MQNWRSFIAIFEENYFTVLLAFTKSVKFFFKLVSIFSVMLPSLYRSNEKMSLINLTTVIGYTDLIGSESIKKYYRYLSRSKSLLFYRNRLNYYRLLLSGSPEDAINFIECYLYLYQISNHIIKYN